MTAASVDATLVALLVSGNLEGELSLKAQVAAEGKERTVVAKKRLAAPAGTLMIELLKPGSTRENPVLELAMLPCLFDAIERLVKGGEPFATPMRLEWQEEEVLVWTLAPEAGN